MYTLIVAPQRRWAELVARQEGLGYGQWAYVSHPRVAQGLNPEKTTILIHEQWVEAPVWTEVEDPETGKKKPHARYPISEALGVLRALGATTKYVST